MSKKTVPYVSRTADKFVVRLPEGMRDKISKVAKGNNRSMNSEIIHRLECSMEGKGGGVGLSTGKLWIPAVGQIVQVKDKAGYYLIDSYSVSHGELLLNLADGSTSQGKDGGVDKMLFSATLDDVEPVFSVIK